MTNTPATNKENKQEKEDAVINLPADANKNKKKDEADQPGPDTNKN